MEESFATAVHEMTHFTVFDYRIDTDGLFRQALRNIGERAGSIRANNLQHEVVGLFNKTRDLEKPDELVAYSMEREATGRHTKLSKEIAKLFMELMDR